MLSILSQFFAIILALSSISFCQNVQKLSIIYSNSNAVQGLICTMTLHICDSLVLLESDRTARGKIVKTEIGKYHPDSSEIIKLKNILNKCFNKKRELMYSFEKIGRGSTYSKSILYFSDTTTKSIQIFNLENEKNLPKDIVAAIHILNDIWNKALSNQSK
jgi:hypothetical protein